MYHNVLNKRANLEGVIPHITELDLGQLAINTFDGKLFIKKDSGVPEIIEIGNEKSELQRVEENGNIGWRLLGQDESNYANIGNEAVDLSISNSPGNYGASGNASFTIGRATSARADAAAAIGLGTISKNINMFSSGQYNVGLSNDTIFEIGIGTINNRKNAFEIYTDGRILAPELDIASITDDKSFITKEYMEANQGAGNLLSDGSIPMDDDYTPDLNQDLITKYYMESRLIDGGFF